MLSHHHRYVFFIEIISSFLTTLHRSCNKFIIAAVLTEDSGVKTDKTEQSDVFCAPFLVLMCHFMFGGSPSVTSRDQTRHRLITPPLILSVGVLINAQLLELFGIRQRFAEMENFIA